MASIEDSGSLKLEKGKTTQVAVTSQPTSTREWREDMNKRTLGHVVEKELKDGSKINATFTRDGNTHMVGETFDKEKRPIKRADLKHVESMIGRARHIGTREADPKRHPEASHFIRFRTTHRNRNINIDIRVLKEPKNGVTHEIYSVRYAKNQGSPRTRQLTP